MKRSAVTVAGICMVLVGLALMVLPGPGILLVVAGLAVLATEYVWARKLLGRAKDEAQRAQENAVAGPGRTLATVLFGLAMCALGVTMLFVEDVAWPVWDPVVDSLWTPVTGGVVIVTSLILLTTTALAVKQSDDEDAGLLG